MIVSIHQPNFMPWLPFFDKVAMVDIFVVMIHCQFEKNGFQNRFNIDEKWYTMSTKKGIEPIKEKVYVNPIKDWEKIKTSLPQYVEVLERFDDCMSGNLSDTNVKIIRRISDMLGIKTKIVLDYETDLRSTDRLVDICKKNGATKYIAGSSGLKYLDLEKFKPDGIEVEIQSIDPSHKIPILERLKCL